MRIPEMLMQRYNKEHLSYSSLKKALTDIALFDLHMKGKVEYKSDALEFGSMYDAILFDLEKLARCERNRIEKLVQTVGRLLDSRLHRLHGCRPSKGGQQHGSCNASNRVNATSRGRIATLGECQ